MVKLNGWVNQQKPTSDSEDKVIRELVIRAVYAVATQKKEALAKKGWTVFKRGEFPKVQLREIYAFYKQQVPILKEVGDWLYPLRDKRTVDRRANEAASVKYSLVDYGTEKPRIVSVKGGYFVPNAEWFK